MEFPDLTKSWIPNKDQFIETQFTRLLPIRISPIGKKICSCKG